MEQKAAAPSLSCMQDTPTPRIYLARVGGRDFFGLTNESWPTFWYTAEQGIREKGARRGEARLSWNT